MSVMVINSHESFFQSKVCVGWSRDATSSTLDGNQSGFGYHTEIIFPGKCAVDEHRHYTAVDSHTILMFMHSLTPKPLMSQPHFLAQLSQKISVTIARPFQMSQLIES